MFDTAWFDGTAGFDASAWSAVLAAPFIGSFLGVLIRRLPQGRPIARSRSTCEGCGTTLAARDLVPVLSWVMGRGRCRLCGRGLGWFYPGVELAALAVALLAAFFDQGVEIWLDCILGWALLALAWIDAQHWLLPDKLTLPLVLAGLAAAVIVDPGELTGRALGAALGYLALRAVAFLYQPSAWARRLGARRCQAVRGGRGLGRRCRAAAGHPDCGACRTVCRGMSAAVGRPSRAIFGAALWSVSGVRDLARMDDASPVVGI